MAARGKQLPAVSAAVAPLAAVDGEQVDGDAAACREAPPTGGTGERTLPAVDAQVSAQVGASGEAAAAEAAAERPSAAARRRRRRRRRRLL